MGKITLTVPEHLIDKAKIAAIRKKTSVSSAVTEFLREFSKDDTDRPSGTDPRDSAQDRPAAGES